VSNIENSLELYKLFGSRGFTWFCKYHFSVEVLAVMVGSLVTRPKGSLADRAWAVIDGVYRWHEELYDLSQKVNMQLAMFLLKAWRNRVQAFAEMGKEAVEAPVTVQELMKRGVPAMNDTSSKSGESSATPASSTGSASGGKSRGSAKSTQDQTDPVLEQFLGGGYMDMSMDWDMWGNIEASGAQGQAPSGGAFGAMGGFGPSGAWQV
jgi:hypothetical protein